MGNKSIKPEFQLSDPMPESTSYVLQIMPERTSTPVHVVVDVEVVERREVVVTEVVEIRREYVETGNQDMTQGFALPEREHDQVVRVKWSHYWPPLGGINCKEPCDQMASGYSWREYVGKAIACPVEFSFGTVVELGGFGWVCMDRGDAIVCTDKFCWVDMLYPAMPYYTFFGYETDARVWLER